jgi:hypothetical protein
MKITRHTTPPEPRTRKPRPTEAEVLAGAARDDPGTTLSVKKASKTPAHRLKNLLKDRGCEARVELLEFPTRKFKYQVVFSWPIEEIDRVLIHGDVWPVPNEPEEIPSISPHIGVEHFPLVHDDQVPPPIDFEKYRKRMQ